MLRFSYPLANSFILKGMTMRRETFRSLPKHPFFHSLFFFHQLPDWPPGARDSSPFAPLPTPIGRFTATPPSHWRCSLCVWVEQSLRSCPNAQTRASLGAGESATIDAYKGRLGPVAARHTLPPGTWPALQTWLRTADGHFVSNRFYFVTSFSFFMTSRLVLALSPSVREGRTGL